MNVNAKKSLQEIVIVRCGGCEAKKYIYIGRKSNRQVCVCVCSRDSRRTSRESALAVHTPFEKGRKEI